MRLFDKLKRQSAFEVLRMEVRIGSRRKLKSLLRNLEIDDQKMNFSSLFSSLLSRMILQNEFDKIREKYPKILKTKGQSYEDLLVNLKMNNKKLKMMKIREYIGAKVLIEEMGARNYRELAEQFGEDNAQWYRLNKGIKSLIIDKQFDPFEIVAPELNNFKTVKLEKYKDKL
jgi:hypothetical protein